MKTGQCSRVYISGNHNKDWKAQYANTFAELRMVDESYWCALWEGIYRGESNSILLDVGCGDGKFLAWIELKNYAVHYVGMDNAIEMLTVAKHKCMRNSLILGDALSLPFCSKLFDGIIMSNVIHLTGTEKPFLKAISRVLNPGGRLVIGVANVDELTRYWEYEFFPSALKIDIQRLPSLALIYKCCTEAKFNHISSKRVLLERREFGTEFLERVRRRHISSLWLIPQCEFEQGLKKLEEEVFKGKRKMQEVALHVLVFEKITTEPFECKNY